MLGYGQAAAPDCLICPIHKTGYGPMYTTCAVGEIPIPGTLGYESVKLVIHVGQIVELGCFVCTFLLRKHILHVLQLLVVDSLGS